MFRKVASLSVAIIVAGGVMIASPAQAAVKVSNGVACTKSRATTKTDLGSYKCGKNPLSTSTKLVWLNLECIAASNSAVKARAAAVITKANFSAQIPVIELGITTETANKAELQTKLDETTLRLAGAQAKLAAAKTDADKKTLTAAVGSWTSATRVYASKVRLIDLTIKKLQAAMLVATSKPTQLDSSIKNSLDTAKLICAKGF